MAIFASVKSRPTIFCNREASGPRADEAEGALEMTSAVGLDCHSIIHHTSHLSVEKHFRLYDLVLDISVLRETS